MGAITTRELTPWERGWKELCAYMISVWHRNVNELDEGAGMKLLGRLPIEAVQEAVFEIAKEGDARLPAWSQVYAKAAAIAKDLRPALPPPDMTRPLSAEERGRAARIGAVLRGPDTGAVRETWRAFSQHARLRVAGSKRGTYRWERCEICDAIAGAIREGGHESSYYARLESECCPVGGPLYSAWRRAVNALVRQVFHPLQESA